MWIKSQGDRGRPIISEFVFTNDSPNPDIRKIDLSIYASGRLMVEIYCSTNLEGLKMSNLFQPLAKRVIVENSYSIVSFECKANKGEEVDELRKLLTAFSMQHPIPQEVIDLNFVNAGVQINPSIRFHKPSQELSTGITPAVSAQGCII